MMEHRYYTRVRASMSVAISTREGISSRYVIRNISYGGMLVELDDLINVERNNGTAKNNNIANNAVVSVKFDVDKFSVALLAMVLRHSDNTAALMFMARTSELQSFLYQLSALDDTRFKAAYTRVEYN